MIDEITFLRELRDALDAMPHKSLISGDFVRGSGCCALGALGKYRGLNLRKFKTDYGVKYSDIFGAPDQLCGAVVNENNAGIFKESSGHRWVRMRAWVESGITEMEAE